MNPVRHIVISPVRDEERYLARTIQCMVAQTVKPAEWILVDDGSTDGTPRLIDSAADTHPWIKPLHRRNRGYRQAGGGVMDAFYDGYAAVTETSWQYLTKLDGDLSFEADYFQQCFGHFASKPRLGIAGGTICNRINGALQPESKIDPAFHVRGATKIYRRECWEQIGGLIRGPGWDTVDEVKANMLGWTTRTFEDLNLVHHRQAGTAYGSWNNLLKNGRANYVAGYHPVFMFMKCVRRALQRPYLMEGIGLGVGYLDACFHRVPQVPDRNLIRYFHRQQLNRLIGRKSLWS